MHNNKKIGNLGCRSTQDSKMPRGTEEQNYEEPLLWTFLNITPVGGGFQNRPTVWSMRVIRVDKMVQGRVISLPVSFFCSSSPMRASIARVRVGSFAFCALTPFFFFALLIYLSSVFRSILRPLWAHPLGGIGLGIPLSVSSPFIFFTLLACLSFFML